MKRILYARFPNWPIQRRRHAEPQTSKRPIVLHHTARNAQHVAARCAEAARLGIQPGMSVGEAKAVCSPEDRKRLDIAPLDEAADLAMLRTLADACERFSPTVGLVASSSPDGVLMEIGGTSHLFGGEIALARQVVVFFRDRRFSPKVAVADTQGAAWAVAHFAMPRSRRIRIVPSEETIPTLRPLRVEALRLEEKTTVLLYRLGIGRIEDIQRLPRHELAARFGEEIGRRYDQAVGRLEEPIHPRHPAMGFSAEVAPDYPITRREGVEYAAEKLLDELLRRLREAGRGVIRLAGIFGCQSGTDTAWSIDLFEPTLDKARLLGLMRLKWERVRFPKAVTTIRIDVPVSVKLGPRQGLLFSLEDDEPVPVRHEIGRLVEHLTSRLGAQSVLGIRLLSDPLPERSFRLQPLVEIGPRHGRRASPPTKPRPVRLFPKPIPITLSPDPATEDLCSCRFRLEGRFHHIRRAWGPERLETGWWRGKTVRRDYYLVETETAGANACRLWIFRSIRKGDWFVHGE